MVMTKIFVVLWSRIEGGKQTIKGSFKTTRAAKAYVNQMKEYDGGWFVVRPYTDVDFITPLKRLVKVIRNHEVGDWSPIADEIFDAEEAIKEAANLTDKTLLRDTKSALKAK